MPLSIVLILLLTPSAAPAAAVAVVFRPPVLVARPVPDCIGCPHPTWITPDCDGFISLGRGVIVSPWNQGLSFALSLDNGVSWRNRTQLHPDPGAFWYAGVGSAWPAIPVAGKGASAGVVTNLGLLPGACNATGHDRAVATACHGFKCSATASPAFATFTVNASAPGGVSVDSSCGQVEFRGYNHPLLPRFGLTDGFTFPTDPVRLGDGSLLMSFALKTADEVAHHDPTHHLPDHYPMNLVVFRSTDGKIWDYLATAVNHTQLPWSYFGPNEHDLSLLSDRKTLVMIMRPDSDSPCPGGPHYRFYYQTYSRDSGLTWTTPRPIPNVGCVRPRLLLLDNGALLLSGGRLCKDLDPAQSCIPTKNGEGGVILWVNADGMADLDGTRNGTEWVANCVTAAHNRGWKGDPSMLFNETTPTQAYTSVVKLGPSSAGVFYQHGWGYKETTVTFMIRADVGTIHTEDDSSTAVKPRPTTATTANARPTTAGSWTPAVVQQPTLPWAIRKDWLLATTGCGARGDGVTDDTQALQRCLASMGSGSTVYLPPGRYLLTATLTMGCDLNVTSAKDPSCLQSASVFGAGAGTVLIWGGKINGTMLWDRGCTHCRYVGLHWNGGGKAAIGVSHRSIVLFETEILHEVSRFSGFTDSGIANDRHGVFRDRAATAEVLYRNMLFENCGTGVSIQDWNSLEHTFDGCLFRNNGAGIAATKGNVYVRNTRFENSSVVDISLEIFWSFSTVQRVVSVGSNQFLRGGGAVSIFEVYVEGWRGVQPKRPASFQGAAIAANAELQIRDSTFVNPAVPERSTVCVLDAYDYNQHLNSWSVLLSNNFSPDANFTCLHDGNATESHVYTGLGSDGSTCAPTSLNRSTNFYKSQWPVVTTVVDVSAFSPPACPADASPAVQAAVNAAAAVTSSTMQALAIAYFPPARYCLHSSISVTSNSTVDGAASALGGLRERMFGIAGGSLLRTIFEWHGNASSAGAVFDIAPGTQVWVEEFEIQLPHPNATLSRLRVRGGARTSWATPHTPSAASASTHVIVNRLSFDGYGSDRDHPNGLEIRGLAAGDVVDVIGIDGDVKVADNAPGSVVVVGFHTAGLVEAVGTNTESGFFGELVRFACCSKNFTTTIRGSQAYAVGAFYQESGPSTFHLLSMDSVGSEAAPRGNVAINGIKLFSTSWRQVLFEGWDGDFLSAGGWTSHQNCDNATGCNVTVEHAAGRANISFLLSQTWIYPLTFKLSAGASFTRVGECWASNNAAHCHAVPDVGPSSAASRAAITRGYDLLRRLGRVDLQVHYPELGVRDCARSWE